MSDLAPTPTPTPRTAALFASVPNIEECRAFCERLERQHAAARAAHNDALLFLHVTTAERDAARAEFAAMQNAARAERDGLLSELADERAKKSDALIAAADDIERLTAARDSLSEALERNCVQYVRKQQALIAERDTLRAELKTAKAERDRALDEAAKEGA